MQHASIGKEGQRGREYKLGEKEVRLCTDLDSLADFPVISPIPKLQQTSVFAFPACNFPPSTSGASIHVTFLNVTRPNRKLYGDFLLVEGIPYEDDKGKLIKGVTISSIQTDGMKGWGEGGIFEFGDLFTRKWKKVAYTGESKFKYR